MATIDHVSSATAKFRLEDPKPGGPKAIELLWGDRVTVLGNGGAGEKKVHARGVTGFVKSSDLGGEPLLEVYFIDVGQGDGTLVVTPNGQHVLIDGGWRRQDQPTGKSAADFVDWKFHRDYGRDRIELDAMICSHNDQDHYGGLWDLIDPDPEAQKELDIKEKNVSIEHFYHAGLSWWSVDGERSLGEEVNTDQGPMFVDLLDNRSSALAALKEDAEPKLQGDWAKFIQCVTQTKTRAGGSTPMKRLSHVDNFVPGFEPQDGRLSIRVLAPVNFQITGHPNGGIHRCPGKTSSNTNGNSLLLRFDYGRVRILMTGDLNVESMQSLLSDWSGQRQEFACDVAKACHHGSDKVSYEFLQAMQPAVTIISSGDSEGHDHPRPSIVAASATTGFLEIKNDALVSPLVYSTELARSLKLGNPLSLVVPKEDGHGVRTITGDDELEKCKVTARQTMSGNLPGSKKNVVKNLKDGYVVTGVVYGLVNVRTDGETILCATMNEAEHKWQVRTITSRF